MGFKSDAKIQKLNDNSKTYLNLNDSILIRSKLLKSIIGIVNNYFLYFFFGNS